jgi:uncharacterized protein YjbI with pentapeptide repeats
VGGSEKISVPLAGPVSFFGFMFLGPVVLIALRAYLQIYVEHSDRLDRLARSVPLMRAPTLVPLKNPVIRVLSGLTFYVLLPVAMMLFAWKAAVFPAWGAGLFGVAVAVIVGHATLPLSRITWRSRALLSAGAAALAFVFPGPGAWGAGLFGVAVAVIVGHAALPLSRITWRSRALLSAGAAALSWGLIFVLGPLHRPFDLHHANLSGQWLMEDNLRYADLSGTELWRAVLTGAHMEGANLRGANLHQADLTGAWMSNANLSGANLSAVLTGAHMEGANLNGAQMFDAYLGGTDLTDVNLSGAFLNTAHMSEAYLRHANLTGARLSVANLNRADLTDANLNGADLTGAYLREADLKGANLSATDLQKADLSGADLSVLQETPPIPTNLSDANLKGAKLNSANLSGVKNLSQRQLDEACGNQLTKLPEGLTLKPCAD